VKLTLDLQQAMDFAGLPSADQFQHWAEAGLLAPDGKRELTVRIVDEAESAALNAAYRHKQGPTNVLSFPFEAPIPEVDTGLLGDVVLCAPVVAREAAAQGKSPEAHWAHLVIHGLLHLQGHDHQQAEQALAMERLEIRILNELGYPDPYGDDALP
jgi:probable rRNA maturation factor